LKIKRRTSSPRHSDYTKYKPLRREDFRYCCAYCGSHERVFGALRNMTIDHLRPKTKFRKLDVTSNPSRKGQLDELQSELIEDLREIIFPAPLAA